MALLKRLRAAIDPSVTIEDLEGRDAFTPFKDIGEHLGRSLGVETPKARRRREELNAQNDLELGLIGGRVASELETLYNMAPENDAHAAVVTSMVDRAAIVSQMLESPFAEMREAGIAELSTLLEDIHSAGLEVEQRRIRDAELEAAGLKEEFSLFSGLYDDLYRESSDFLTVQSSYGALRASYANGIENAGNANDIAAINSLQRMIDPGVSVREGDVSLLTNLAGVPSALVTTANRVFNEGARFTAEQRLEILALGNDLMKDRNALQQERNARFQGIGSEAGIGEGLLSRLALPIEDTGALPSYRETVGEAREGSRDPDTRSARAGRSLGEATNRGVEAVRQGVGGFIEGAFGVDVVNGRVYSRGSIGAERARLNDLLEKAETNEEKLDIRRQLDVLNAAEGRPPRRGVIVRPTN